MGKIDLAAGFSAVSAKQWKQQLQYELGGADYNATLVWESPEGIKVKPFYNREDLDGKSPRQCSSKTSWKIGQSIPAADPEKANNLAKHALAQGVTALQFHIASEQAAPDILLKDIDLEATEIHCHLDFLSAPYVEVLLDQFPAHPAAVFLHLDVIGQLVRRGTWYAGRKEDFLTLSGLLQSTGDRQGVHLLGIDGQRYQNAGANRAQQLAYMLAHAHEYLHAFGEWFPALPTFAVAVGSDYFFEIAKLRALRLLWKTLAKEYGRAPDCHILAVPSLRNKTLYDYNTNMLRTTSECMAAILGNANTLVNLPYDALFHEPNEFADRLARNQLLLLKHEAQLGGVANPADGAYYIETLTRQLAEQALTLFRQLEAGGGLLQQLKRHTLQKKVRESADREQRHFNEGAFVLVGANAFAKKEERMKGELERSTFRKSRPGKTALEPLPVRRLAEGLEQKRLDDE